MRTALLCALAGLAAGVALSSVLGGGARETARATLSRAPPPVLPPSRPYSAPLEEAAPAATSARPEPAIASNEARHDAENAGSDNEPRPAADRTASLGAAGFTPARAEQILRREAELRQAPYLAELQASGTVRPLGASARASTAAALRAELGDADYERYLAGTGQPSSVVVRAVEAESAAAYAGLLPGDEIRAYAGERVFNQRDLNALMLAGTPGEVVPTTVVRDGQTLHLYVTRGPLGLL